MSLETGPTEFKFDHPNGQTQTPEDELIPPEFSLKDIPTSMENFTNNEQTQTPKDEFNPPKYALEDDPTPIPIENPTKKELSKLMAPHITVQVYSASDFSPRGSLVKNITSDFSLSDIPNHLNTKEKIIQEILSENIHNQKFLDNIETAMNPDEDFWYKEYGYGDEYTPCDLSKRKAPNKIHPQLTLGFLRKEIRYIKEFPIQKIDPETNKFANKYDYRPENPIVLIVVNEDPSLLYIFDLKRKSISTTIRSERQDQTEDTYFSRTTEHDPIPKDKLPFAYSDMRDVGNTLISRDELDRKNYPKSTEKFRDIILWADSKVEEILIEKINLVIPTHESIRNISERRGREYVRSQLVYLRTNPFDSSHPFIEEIHQDIEFSNKAKWIDKVLSPSTNIEAHIYQCDKTINNLLQYPPGSSELINKMYLLKHRLQNNEKQILGLMESLPHSNLETQVEITTKINQLLPTKIQRKLKKSLSKNEITLGLQTLLEAERPYLWAAYNTPWNQVGPQPFDSTINVFWFRFHISNLKNSWEGRRKHISDIKGRYHKEAAIKRIYAYAYSIEAPVGSFNGFESDRPKFYGSFRDIAEHTGMTIEQIRSNAKKEFPLENYLDRKGMESQIRKFIYSKPQKSDRSIRPSYLTKLLWATLKFEAAVPQWKNSRTERIDRNRNEFLKITPDPKWMGMGDHLGRLVLPGESLSNPLPHQVSGEDNFTIASLQIAQKLEENGIEYTLDELGDYANKLLEENLKNHKQRDVVNQYKKTVKNTTFSELIKATYSLKGIQRAIVLHRLGYTTPQACITPRSKVEHLSWGIEAGTSIGRIVSTYFQKKPYRYYQSLKKATQNLQSQLKKQDSHI